MRRMLDIAASESLLKALGLTPVQITERLGTIAHLTRAYIVNQAKNGLKTTEREYVQGLLPEAVGDNGAMLVLVGTLANMVEWGWYEGVGVDLRQILLRSSTKSVRYGRDGYRYLHVPFRHMLQGSTGRNASVIGNAYTPVLGNQGSLKLAKRVEKHAKALAPKTATKRGGRLPASEGGPLLRARHATGQYTGMQRVRHKYSRGTGTQYMTFRTISENPDTFRADANGMNWFHPGITARHFFIQAQEYIAEITPDVWMEGLDQATKDVILEET